MKQAYPNYDYYMPIAPVRDTKKWIQTVKDLYYQVHKGASYTDTLSTLTENWGTMEKLDFEHWLRFYEEGAQNKYKVAQMAYWGDQNNLGYYLPIPQEKKPEMPHLDMNTMNNPSKHPDMMQEEKRNTIEKQRQKIVSRLDATERLLRSQEGQTFAGNEFETLIEAIHQLKKKILVVNKISTSVKLYQDMIIREANILNGRGHKQASSFLIKIAQDVPSAAEPANPALVDGGQAGTLPGQAPGQVPPGNNPPADISVDLSQQGAPPETPPSVIPEVEPISPGMKEFLAGLDTAKNPVSVDEMEVDEADAEDADFVVEAQAAGPALGPEPVVEVEEAPQDAEVQAGQDFDAKLDNMFADLTVADVVNKLEDLSKIFKTREIPRQLALVDLMLDRLGLASFFPELSESAGKANDMTMYIGSRLDNILSQLRGTLATRDLDLRGEGGGSSPVPEVQQRLQAEQEKEKAKKQMRKDLADKSLEDSVKPEPTVELQQDLSQPAQVAPLPAVPATSTPPVV